MIDIKELRAGCHLLLSNRRVKVANIDSLNNLIGVEDYYYVTDDGTKYCIGNEPKNTDPIPITEELLKELGFEVRPFKYRLKAEKYLSEYDEFLMLERMKGEDKFDIYLYISKEETHKTHLKYLHELETFVYLTTKKELI